MEVPLLLEDKGGGNVVGIFIAVAMPLLLSSACAGEGPGLHA